MSREVRYQTQIVIPEPEMVSADANIKDQVLSNGRCMRLLASCVERVAVERRGRVKRHFTDCQGRKHKCLFSVQTKDFPRGVGVRVDGQGQVSFVYDAQTKGRLAAKEVQAADRICDEIAQTYATKAMHHALRSCGFQTSDHVQHQAQQRTVLVHGVKQS